MYLAALGKEVHFQCMLFNATDPMRRTVNKLINYGPVCFSSSNPLNLALSLSMCLSVNGNILDFPKLDSSEPGLRFLMLSLHETTEFDLS